MSEVLYTLSLSLFDSFSTTQQIVIFILLLTTIKPLRNSMAYLAGLSGSYLACGVVGYLAIDQLHTIIDNLPSTTNMPDDLYYKFEFIFGIVMMLVGIWYYRRKRQAPPDRYQNSIVLKLKSMNGIFAFSMGAFISISSFPVSIPYIIAISKYTTLHVSLPAAIGYIMLYNFGYALPMIVIFIIYLFARIRTEDLQDTLHEKSRVLNVQLTTWAFIGVGILSMVDSGWFFTIGHALIKGRLMF
jgi:cytochrome c biogenesis protein CcdA